MKLSDITATDGRVKNAISPVIDSVVDSKIEKQIKKEIDKSKIQIGVLSKYYPYLDKAEVKLGNKTVLCKILHRMHGSLVDFFTPLGESSFCETLKEPCIIPRGELDCLVADINDDTKERLLLGYFLKNDIIYTRPANPGHYRVADFSATNEYGLDVGVGDILLNSNKGVTFTEGFVESENTVVEYANNEDVYDKGEVYTKKETYNKTETYNKQEVYTKEEVDKLIEDLKEELLGDTDDTTD